jgi:predicted enzyme related to lactoylglutathione lyase
MFQRFTEEARRTVVLAQDEARRLQHNYIGTEHLLLGLLRVPDGVAAVVFGRLGVTTDTARREVEEIVGPGSSPPEGYIPFTPEAKKIFELSLREALQRADKFIGAEHILLALLREGEGVGAQVLLRLGVGLDQMQDAVGPPQLTNVLGWTWFELYADDMDRAVDFYRRAFGWLPQPATAYAELREPGAGVIDGQLLVSPRGQVVGAVVPRPSDLTAPAPDARGCVVYLKVGDVAETAAAAIMAGGVEVSPPRRVSPLGTVALVRDTEGNLIGLHSAAQ